MEPEKLTKSLEESRKKIEKDAKEYGLDFFPTIFYILKHDDLNQIMSYSGFPKRYKHWTHGMTSIYHENMEKYGYSKAYELVINNDPSHAFLLKNNSDVINRFVMAHVLGHVDFFKNNLWFKPTDRSMIDTMSRHAEHFDNLEQKYGEEDVEKTIDACIMVESLIDQYSLYKVTNFESLEKRLNEDYEKKSKPQLVKTSDPFLDKLINTPERIRKEWVKIEEEKERMKKFPRKLQKDVLKFIIDNSRTNNLNLPKWKLKALSMIRKEAYYFVPQMVTKIMNEGWASYWHEKLMLEKKHCGDDGLIEFINLDSAVTSFRKSPGPINPYALGKALFKWIEYRWDTGKHGKEYENCNNMYKKFNWDTREMKGKEMIFLVRKYYNDPLFIKDFLTQTFCDEHQLWTYGQDRNGRVVVQSKDVNDIKDSLLKQFYNGGKPLIYVKDGNYKNSNQLLLYHDFKGRGLDMQKTLLVMKSLRSLWGKDVNLETKIELENKDQKIAIDGIYTVTEKTQYLTMFDPETGEEVAIKEFE